MTGGAKLKWRRKDSDLMLQGEKKVMLQNLITKGCFSPKSKELLIEKRENRKSGFRKLVASCRGNCGVRLAL